VGNTPLLAIEARFRGSSRLIYAKCQQLNLTGSIKDRIALYILSKAYSKGELHPGDTIIEATSGNTGISFAAFGAALAHPVKIFMPDWMSRERRDLIRSFWCGDRLGEFGTGRFRGKHANGGDICRRPPRHLPSAPSCGNGPLSPATEYFLFARYRCVLYRDDLPFVPTFEPGISPHEAPHRFLALVNYPFEERGAVLDGVPRETWLAFAVR